MFKQIFLALLFSVVTGTANADTQRADYQNPASPEETAGFFSGAVLGGLAGGPPGIIVGAAFGALFGDGWHAKSEVADLQLSLYESQLRLAALHEQSQALQTEHQLTQQKLDELSRNPARAYPATLTISDALCCDNTVVTLNFRSGSSEIEFHYEEQLDNLVNIARKIPTASVEITGYADRNGDAELNLKLSQQRSNTVKDFLQGKGIQNSSLKTIAYGETRPLHSSQNFESDFFDRRVIIRLRDNSGSMLTQNPDAE